MRYFNSLLWSFSSGTALLMLSASTFADPFPSDAVEKLRSSLRIRVNEIKTMEELDFRLHDLSVRAKAISDVGEMRQALELQEWRDEDRDMNVSKVDSAVRDALVKEFEERLRILMKHEDPLRRAAAACVLSETKIHIRGSSSSKGGLARPLTRDLVRLLEDKDARVREAAARALGQINPEIDATVPALKEMMSKGQPGERRAAATALADLVETSLLIVRGRNVTSIEMTQDDFVKIGAVVVPVAARGAADADVMVRRQSVRALQQAALAAGDPALMPEPQSKLEFPPQGRKWSDDETALVAGYLKQVETELERLLPLAMALKQNVPASSAVLKDDDEENCLLAAKLLETLGETRDRVRKRVDSVPGGISKKELREKVDDAFTQALRAALPGVMELAGHKEIKRRLAALYVLETMEADAELAVPVLLKTLKDDNSFARWAAVRALGRMPPPKNAAPIVKDLAELLDREKNGDVYVTILAAIERYGPAAALAVPSLGRVIRRGDDDVREYAIKALVAIGTEGKAVIPELIEVLLKKETPAHFRRAAVHALARFAPIDRPAFEALGKALDDSDGEVRRLAGEGLLREKKSEASSGK